MSGHYKMYLCTLLEVGLLFYILFVCDRVFVLVRVRFFPLLFGYVYDLHFVK